ncbi:MAG: SRPBCC family protein [Actinomycetota bacterium]|nr:SRPBCC family protein [Actinomycetota bacterium]
MAAPLHVEYDFTKPPARIFAYLSEHEHLEPLLSAKITRLTDGTDGERNGVGSSRRMKVGPLPPFVETVTEAVPDERIAYRITRGGPLKDHAGTMRFSPTVAGGMHLVWDIHLDSAGPGVATIVNRILQRSITRSLPDVDRKA